MAELGPRTSFYSIAAGHIARRGKVYAVEIIKDYLETIKEKVKEAHLSNVEILWGDIGKLGGTKLRDGIIDAVIASNILFQIDDKEQFVLEIKRILKQKGRVLLIDWSQSQVVVGGASIVSKNKAREMFEKKGFILEREINAGEHHYGMIFIKS